MYPYIYIRNDLVQNLAGKLVVLFFYKHIKLPANSYRRFCPFLQSICSFNMYEIRLKIIKSCISSVVFPVVFQFSRKLFIYIYIMDTIELGSI